MILRWRLELSRRFRDAGFDQWSRATPTLSDIERRIEESYVAMAFAGHRVYRPGAAKQDGMEIIPLLTYGLSPRPHATAPDDYCTWLWPDWRTAPAMYVEAIMKNPDMKAIFDRYPILRRGTQSLQNEMLSMENAGQHVDPNVFGRPALMRLDANSLSIRLVGHYADCGWNLERLVDDGAYKPALMQRPTSFRFPGAVALLSGPVQQNLITGERSLKDTSELEADFEEHFEMAMSLEAKERIAVSRKVPLLQIQSATTDPLAFEKFAGCVLLNSGLPTYGTRGAWPRRTPWPKAEGPEEHAPHDWRSSGYEITEWTQSERAGEIATHLQRNRPIALLTGMAFAAMASAEHEPLLQRRATNILVSEKLGGPIASACLSALNDWDVSNLTFNYPASIVPLRDVLENNGRTRGAATDMGITLEGQRFHL